MTLGVVNVVDTLWIVLNALNRSVLSEYSLLGIQITDYTHYRLQTINEEEE